MFRYFRMLGLFFLLCVVVGLTTTGLFRVGVAKALLATADHVMRFSGAEVQDVPRPVELNGQRMFLSSGRTAQSLSEVVKSYAGECEHHQRELFNTLFTGHMGKWASQSWLFQPFRGEGNGKGVVACLKLNPRIKTRDDFVNTAKHVLKTGQIGLLVSLRYVAAHAGKQRTFFNAVWTDQTLDFGKMFSEKGDVPGKDLIDVPRPPQSRRLVDFGEAQHPEHMLVYLANQSAEVVHAYYDKTLAQTGWKRIGEGEPRIYAMDGHVVVVGYKPTNRTQGHVTILRTK